MFMHSTHVTLLPQPDVLSSFYSKHTLTKEFSIFVRSVSRCYQNICQYIYEYESIIYLLISICICNKYK